MASASAVRRINVGDTLTSADPWRTRQQTAVVADLCDSLVDKRKLGKRGLWHFSWWRIITEAIVQSRYRGISDPDQAWILGELLAYLDSEASGAGGFADMGDNWVAVRKAAHDGTLRANTQEARDVAEWWEELSQYLCLGLSQDLGRTVTAVRPRNQTTEGSLEGHLKRLAETGSLEATLRVPDAVGDVLIQADLRARQTLTSVKIDAPGEGRPKSRISWILRQLVDAPNDLRIEVAYPSARQTTSQLLGAVRDNADLLLHPHDAARPPRSFVLTLARAMGQKRGKAEGSFVRETRAQTFDFYRDLVQNLKPWQARAPKLREPPSPEEVGPGPQAEPPPFGSDERDPGEAVDPAATPELTA